MIVYWMYSLLERIQYLIKEGLENCPPKESKACFTSPLFPHPPTRLILVLRNFIFSVSRDDWWLCNIFKTTCISVCFELFKHEYAELFTIMLTSPDDLHASGLKKESICCWLFKRNFNGIQIKHWLLWEEWFSLRLSYTCIHWNLKSWWTIS